jgi:predicted adenylyl cyclase CyaB
MPRNYEFKARHPDIAQLEQIIRSKDAVFAGEDHQVDTYFNVPNGRLKLREGKIENALIHYERSNLPGAKQSDVILFKNNPGSELKALLVKALGIKTVIDKRRRIYFVDNLKFHFDEVAGLGKFVEVEAIDKDGTIGIDQLREQCNVYAQLFNLQGKDFIAESYSDMLLAKKSSTV